MSVLPDIDRAIMTGQIADFFVGGVSIILGLVILAGALLNWERAYVLKKTRWLEERLGRSGARAVLSVLGVGLIALGIAIAMGYAPNASARFDSAAAPTRAT